MFKEMEETFKEQVFSLIQTINTEIQPKISMEINEPKQTLVTSHNEPNEFSDTKKVIENKTKTVGRNDPCPCDSGKKYKKCHGA